MAENDDLNEIDLDEEIDDEEDEGKNAKYSDLWGQDSSQQEDDENAMEDEIFDEMREQDLQTDSKNKNSRESQINKLEQKLISKKTWQLKGEIAGTNRPQDSLIKENLDFKSGIRLQEEITKEDNDNLEKIIKQRILDQLWDDNELQDSNNKNNIQENFNSLPETNFEKPKGLAETYEDEYKQSVLQLPNQKPEDKTKAEIELQFKQLCYKLDLLSNLNFTPKPLDSKPAEILTNVPTILREENIPIFISSKQVMSEKELFKNSKDATFFDKQELTPEEKLKLRQKMKKNFKSRQRHNLLKKKIAKLTASNKFAYNLIQKNKKQQKIMEEMKKEKSVKFTKSADFFKNLQDNQDVKKQQKKKK